MRSGLHRASTFSGRLWSVFTLLMIAITPALSDEAKFDVRPWVEDLRQIRSSMSAKYANLEWAVFERDIDLSNVFDETEVRLQSAGSDQNAKAIIDRSLVLLASMTSKRRSGADLFW
jgi:hypothetical protein